MCIWSSHTHTHTHTHDAKLKVFMLSKRATLNTLNGKEKYSIPKLNFMLTLNSQELRALKH